MTSSVERSPCGSSWSRWRCRLVAIVVVAGLSAVGCGGSVPALPALSDDAVVVAFGDSLTSGVGARPGQSYPAVLQQLTGLRVVNAGVSGEVSAEGLERLPRVLDEYGPDLVILCHGGNDLLRDVDPAVLEDNLRGMVIEARSRGIPVVLVGVPEPGLFLSSAELYERLAEELSLPYEADVLPAIESDRRLKSDPIHPNAEGYRRLAQALRTLLHEAGAL